MNWAFLLPGLVSALPLPRALPVPHALALQESAFLAGLEDVHRAMELQRWVSARDGLRGLLDDHEGARYLAAHVPVLREDARRCAFWVGREAPDAGDLVEGELVHWSPHSGRVRLSYRRDQLADFERSGARVFHPLEFDGAHSIHLRGKRYPVTGASGAPVLWVGMTGDAGVAISFGHASNSRGPGLPTRILHVDGESQELVAELDRSPVEAGRPFDLRVEVRASEVRLQVDRKRVLTARVRVESGRFGLEHPPEFDALEVDGTATGAWLQGLVDSAVQGEWGRFVEGYDEGRHLPAWLLEGRFEGRERSADDDEPEPLEWLDELRRIQTEEGLEDGLAFARTLGGNGTPHERKIATALALYDLERFEECLVTCDGLLVRRAGDADARILRARCLAGLRRLAEAESEYRSALTHSPRSLAAHVELARMLLADGRPLEAKSVVEKALAQGLQDESLDALTRILVKALRGPDWPQTHRHESRHYEVISDIDRELCRDAAELLESAYRMFQSHLMSVRESADKKKFKVLLFSGQAGYEAYARETFGHARPETTWGLYSPNLKQLLIWNLPSREAMLETVRHEGFHQYFDRLTDRPPTWLDEGLAEYYEGAERLRGRRSAGPVQPDHVRLLRGKELVPLERFLALSSDEFYAQPELHYAQAWAFVHFLRHGNPRAKALFQRILRGLLEDRSDADVMERVFGKEDLDAMGAELRAYVEGLEAAPAERTVSRRQ